MNSVLLQFHEKNEVITKSKFRMHSVNPDWLKFLGWLGFQYAYLLNQYKVCALSNFGDFSTT